MLNTTPAGELRVIKRWSFSTLSKYETCPLAAKKQIIDRLPKKASPAADRGNLIHESIERYIRGEHNELPKEALAVQPLIDKLRINFDCGKAFVEDPWAFNSAWEPCGFEDEDAWTRGLLDAALWISPTHLHGFDWKTGKRYPPKHLQQEQLYTAYAFRKMPQLEQFSFSFVYLDEGLPLDKCATMRTYTPAQAEILRQIFHRRGMRMTTDVDFQPRPSMINCRYCDYKETCEWRAE